MWGTKQRLKVKFSDFPILLGLLVISLVPWIPFVQKGVSGSLVSYPSYGQDQMHYIARAFSIWKGKLPSETFVPRGTGLTDGLGNFAEAAFFLPSKFPLIDNLNFATYFYILLCICLFAALASTYSLFKFLTTSKRDAILITIVFIYFSQMIDLGGVYFPAMPIFNRWPTPMLHYLGIFILLRALIDRELRFRKVIGSLSLAFGFYLYLYTWQVMLAILLAALVINFINRDVREVKDLLSISVVGLVLGFPTILGVVNLLLRDQSDGLLEFAFRQENSHSMIIDKMSILLAIVALVVFTIRRRISSKITYLVYLFAITGLVISNQQVFTGKILQPGHFHWYFVAPAIFSCLTILYASLFKKQNWKNLVTFFLIFLLGLNQIQAFKISQVESMAQSTSALTSQQITALRGVVFTQDPSVLDQLVTGYSGDVYWHSFGIYYGGSRDIANEYVAFSSVWMGSESPIQLSPPGIKCLSFEFDPCSTSRMLLGSASNLGWWEYLAKGNPVGDSLASKGDLLRNELKIAGKNPARYFSSVIKRRDIQTIIARSPVSPSQLVLLDEEWTLISKSSKFWIYSRINS